MSSVAWPGEGKLINARGPFTPLGVSRSSESVVSAVSNALRDFADISALQDSANSALSDYAACEAGTVVHCAAAGITLAVAAAMTRSDPNLIAALPDTNGLRNRVILPLSHAVNYGQPIEQAIKLAGATPVIVGSKASCTVCDIAHQLAHKKACCLLLVVSRLTSGKPIDLRAAINAARKADVPVVIDGAAQFFKARELIELGADLLIVSGQKYLAAPTAGLVFGRSDLVEAVRAQEKGIGRGMKATKEALCGVLAALREWNEWNQETFRRIQAEKLSRLIDRLNSLRGVLAIIEPDLTNAPFDRVCLKIDATLSTRSAVETVQELRAGFPSIWVMDHRAVDNEIVLEVVPLRENEVDVLVERFAEILN